MGLLRNLKLWISPPQITDPNFGKLTFMHIDKHPERSYWECNWNFPPTSTVVFITLPGGENGPTNEARQFYLGLLARYDFVLTLCRPKLEQVFREWRSYQLPQDVFTVVRLSGFEVEDPNQQPLQWNVNFETTDDDWLGITIPFVGDMPEEPKVDT